MIILGSVPVAGSGHKRAPRSIVPLYRTELLHPTRACSTTAAGLGERRECFPSCEEEAEGE